MRRRLAKLPKTKEKSSTKLAANPLQEIELQTEVVHMSSGGLSHEEIADVLGITVLQVTRFLADGLQQYLSSRDAEVRQFISLQNARYNRIYREWMPRMESKVVEEKEPDGNVVERSVSGDPIAARIVLKALSDHARVCGMNKVRVEHSGQINNTILDINVDLDRVLENLSDEALARFKETKDIRILQLAASTGDSNPSRAGDPPTDEDEG